MPPRILVVDDSATIRRIVAGILERNGYEAALAHDGQAALDILAVNDEAKIDLVLLDFVMPKMNGYQFCRIVRQNSQIATIPIILMSAKSDTIRDQFVVQTGAIDAISKPFDAQALVTVLDNAFRRQAGNRDASARYALLPDAPFDGASKSDPPAEAVLSGEFGALPLGAVLQLLQVESQSGALVVSRGESEITIALRDGLIDLVWSRGTTDEFRLGRYFVEEGLLSREELDEILKAVPAPEGAPNEPVTASEVPHERTTAVLPRDVPQDDPTSQLPKSDGGLGDTNPDGSPRVSQLPDTVRVDPQAPEQPPESGVTAPLPRAESPDVAVPVPVPRRLLGDRLVASGRITHRQLADALTRQSSELVYEMLRWPRGRFALHKATLAPHAAAARLGLTMPAVVMEGFRRADEWRVLERTVGDFERVLVQDPLAIGSLPAGKLTRAESRLLHAIDGERTVREVIALSEMSSFDACRILAELLEARLVRGKSD